MKKKKLIQKKITALFGVEIKGVDRDSHTLSAIFSTADTDRHGDIVHQNWDLKFFKKNPVILNSHNYNDATEVIGRSETTGVVDGRLEGTIKFAVAENPKAKIIFDLYAGGFLNAFSVGFMPNEFNDKGEITASELLEVSAVSVPANAMALAKKKGIDVDQLYEDTDEEDDSTEDPIEDEVGDEEDTDNGGGSEAGEGEDESTPPGSGTDGEDPTAKAVSPLEKIAKAIKSVESELKVETRPSDVKAHKRRLINKAIRELTKLKRQV